MYTKRLKESEKHEIVGLYVDELVPMIELAEKYGKTRQGIWKILKVRGVNTTKRKLEVQCKWCEKVFDRTKGRIRSQKYHFCCTDCYYSYIGEIGINYKPNRHGQRIGRMKVSEYFELLPGMVVHHEDGDDMNNQIENLKVFANNGDHVRYHRWVHKVDPIWDGRKV